MFSSPRVISVALCISIAVATWVWLNQQRNDLVQSTRSLIGQVRKGDEQTEVSLFVRMHCPEGDPDTQRQVFDRLIYAMRRDAPRQVSYGEEGKWEPDEKRWFRYRDVRVEGDHGTVYTVRWVRVLGRWYILDCKQPEAQADAGHPVLWRKVGRVAELRQAGREASAVRLICG